MDLSRIRKLPKKVELHRYIRFRRRYFFTRSERLRVRYAVVCAFLALLVVGQFFSAVNGSFAFAKYGVINSDSSNEESNNENVMVLASLNEAEEDVSNFDGNAGGEGDVLTPLLQDKRQGGEVYAKGFDDAGVKEKVLKIGAGDTISGALQDVGVSAAEAYRAVKAMSEHYDPRKIKPGQAIAIRIEDVSEGRVMLTSLDMKMSPVKALRVYKDEHERFKAELVEKEVVMKLKASRGAIDSSLYASAARAGIPASLVAEMIRLYSYEVDFQRDIRKGDKVEILYETYETEDGEFSHYGNLLYASLNVNKTDIPIYRFEREGCRAGFFHDDGSSLRQLLMKTPVDGARISSGYGMRVHPILGYSKMHKGMDFAAPRGTPIYAAGDGVVERASRFGSYGNYMRIRHNGTYKTAYAHMQKFAKGVIKGKRVKQGQVIGYVGNTGRSTGPHLHYEVIKNGKQINPRSVKSSNREKLSGSDLSAFKAQVVDFDKQYASLAQKLEFAGN